VTSLIDASQRFSRQVDLVPAERLAQCRATVVGVGAIGRQVALQLAALGIPALTLVDFDTVEVGNLAAQGFLEADLTRPKVEATAELCRKINGTLEVCQVPERFRRNMEIGNVFFCCVDKIEVRKLIWDAVKEKVSFYADGRMSAEVIRVLVACDGPSREHYPTTLFSAEEAFQGACTAKSTIYSANIAAGFMVAQFAKWLRRLPVDADVNLNLLANELTVAGA
jgi:sulfur carrier protein ThiS adenylyltransferase